MKICSILNDSRIDAKNILVEMTIDEYINISRSIIHKNEFQRKRVRSSKTIYALLKEDLLKQCIIPPIVLALPTELDFDEEKPQEFNEKINENKDDLVILDGLQRTYTILDLVEELAKDNKQNELIATLESKIRVEIYNGLNRLGILYRMLTLNTGQTPMSIRQQIEILYLDYTKVPFEGITLVKDKDDASTNELHEYKFKEIVEGFNSYITRDELALDRTDLLENISSLEKLSKENTHQELFEEYVKSLNTIIVRINNLVDDISLDEEFKKQNGSPFGYNIKKIFKRSQAYTGFGAAAGKLIDLGAIDNLEAISLLSNELIFEKVNSYKFLEHFNLALLEITKSSKKIGNAQRAYFVLYFREIFNPESDCYLDIFSAINSAKKKYNSLY
ncbi:Uncharacterised protein [Serratia marcescens]|uniref:hypothetical protein n=1 Tax=Serratia marcescens TaxID=615 RepID=UPI002177C682|nr:hypothetical protein [Serratia marcescens]CAI1672404.1 Uncharacterised protein [Serratia marcescens]